jgi:hypothetical protein
MVGPGCKYPLNMRYPAQVIINSSGKGTPTIPSINKQKRPIYPYWMIQFRIVCEEISIINASRGSPLGRKACTSKSPLYPRLTEAIKQNPPFFKGKGGFCQSGGTPRWRGVPSLNTNPPLGSCHALIQWRCQEDGRRSSLNLQADNLILLGL